jgi:hypothetical protein
MVVGVGFCKIKVDSNFLLVLKIKCTKFHQDRSKTVDLYTKYTNKQTFSFIYIDFKYFPFFLLSRFLSHCAFLFILLSMLFRPLLSRESYFFGYLVFFSNIFPPFRKI